MYFVLKIRALKFWDFFTDFKKIYPCSRQLSFKKSQNYRKGLVGRDQSGTSDPNFLLKESCFRAQDCGS